MKLFHGTSFGNYERISTEGLRPRGSGSLGNFGHGSPSHPDAVYLTDTYPLYFATVPAEDTRGVVIEIETDDLVANLVVDEDALACAEVPLGARRSPARVFAASARHRDAITASSTSWRQSLDILGTCAHMGPIPAAAITRVAIIDFAQQPLLALAAADISINAANFQFCAYDHQCMTAWVFGDPMPAPDHPSAAMSFHRLPEFTPAYTRDGRSGIFVQG